VHWGQVVVINSGTAFEPVRKFLANNLIKRSDRLFKI